MKAFSRNGSTARAKAGVRFSTHCPRIWPTKPRRSLRQLRNGTARLEARVVTLRLKDASDAVVKIVVVLAQGQRACADDDRPAAWRRIRLDCAHPAHSP